MGMWLRIPLVHPEAMDPCLNTNGFTGLNGLHIEEVSSTNGTPFDSTTDSTDSREEEGTRDDRACSTSTNSPGIKYNIDEESTVARGEGEGGGSKGTGGGEGMVVVEDPWETWNAVRVLCEHKSWWVLYTSAVSVRYIVCCPALSYRCLYVVLTTLVLLYTILLNIPYCRVRKTFWCSVHDTAVSIILLYTFTKTTALPTSYCCSYYIALYVYRIILSYSIYHPSVGTILLYTYIILSTSTILLHIPHHYIFHTAVYTVLLSSYFTAANIICSGVIYFGIV